MPAIPWRKNMIRKLRIKLILTSMLSLIAVLSFIICISTVISYHRIVLEADAVLELLERNDGDFPDSSVISSPELPFESRYFSVQLTEIGGLIAVDIDQIAAVDQETAIEYARKILESGTYHGFMGNYRYTAMDTGDSMQILFLDCGRSLRSFQNFVITSIMISILGVTAVLILIIFLSRKMVLPMAESYEKQRRFITDAGHELKTPLAIINADADVLEMDVGKSEWIDDIKHQTKRLASLTSDLITLSRMEETREQTQTMVFSLSDLAEKAVQSFQSMAIAEEKEFAAKISPNLMFRGDEKALARLLSILLDNALKYCPAHGTISFSLDRWKKHYRLILTNTCEEIHSADLPHLFDRFYRTDQSRNSSTGGSGIGLSIASAIVTAHRGKISASTADGKSLTMTLLLPAGTNPG